MDIEKIVKGEWKPGSSAGAVARQVCRELGCSGRAPTLKKLLEEMLADANRASFDRSCILSEFEEASPDAAKIARHNSFDRNNELAAA